MILKEYKYIYIYHEICCQIISDAISSATFSRSRGDARPRWKASVVLYESTSNSNKHFPPLLIRGFHLPSSQHPKKAAERVNIYIWTTISSLSGAFHHLSGFSFIIYSLRSIYFFFFFFFTFFDDKIYAAQPDWFDWGGIFDQMIERHCDDASRSILLITMISGNPFVWYIDNTEMITLYGLQQFDIHPNWAYYTEKLRHYCTHVEY